MGLYVFSHPKTGKIIEIVLSVNSEKVYIDKKGVKWNREYTVPHAAIDTQTSLTSAQEFDRKMGNKKGMTVGEMWDSSKELSQKRERLMGKDPLKEKAKEDYAKKRKGRKPRNFD